jgi:hypothetical protein
MTIWRRERLRVRDPVAQTVEERSLLAPLFRTERTQRFQQFADGALLAQRRDAQRFQRRFIGGVRGRFDKLPFQRFDIAHGDPACWSDDPPP